MSKQILTIELIPSTCFFSNARTLLSKSNWDKVRKISYNMANNKCEICGDTGKNQGYNHNVECHEIWEYDDVNKIQKLIGLISLCVLCHQVKHIGRSIAIKKYELCEKHMMKINNWNKIQVSNYIKQIFETHKERSKHQWGLDLSILKEEPYNLKFRTPKKRKFKPKRKRPKRKK